MRDTLEAIAAVLIIVLQCINLILNGQVRKQVADQADQLSIALRNAKNTPPENE